MSPLDVLKAVKEYTVQRCFDLECLVPSIALDDSASVTKPDPLGDDNGEPFPDTGESLVKHVAEWVVAVKKTKTEEQAESQYAKKSETQKSKRRRGAYPNDEDEEDDDSSVDTTSADEVAKEIESRLADSAAKWSPIKENLRNLLVKLESLYEDAFDVNGVFMSSNDAKIAEYLVTNKDEITTPTIAEVRLNPRPSYYDSRQDTEKKLMRWTKIALCLYDDGNTESFPQDVLFDDPVKHTANVPDSLDGSFFSGKVDQNLLANKRLKDMTLEHLVARSHMKNCLLVKEFGFPQHIAFNTVFATKSENSAKSDKYLPLGNNQTRYSLISQNSTIVYGKSSSEFTVPRRCMASRAVCATYLSLFMLEKKADGHTELGARRGGVYFNFRDDIFDLSKTVQSSIYPINKLYSKKQDITTAQAQTRLDFRKAWLWEEGLQLLAWYYLDQPYNPLPRVAYRQAAERPVDDTMIPFYEDLIARRFQSTDMLSHMMRIEMQEEVSNAPGTSDGSDMENPRRLAGALSTLRRSSSADFL
jgi:hypothetical protein